MSRSEATVDTPITTDRYQLRSGFSLIEPSSMTRSVQLFSAPQGGEAKPTKCQ